MCVSMLLYACQDKRAGRSDAGHKLLLDLCIFEMCKMFSRCCIKRYFLFMLANMADNYVVHFKCVLGNSVLSLSKFTFYNDFNCKETMRCLIKIIND